MADLDPALQALINQANAQGNAQAMVSDPAQVPQPMMSMGMPASVPAPVPDAKRLAPVLSDYVARDPQGTALMDKYRHQSEDAFNQQDIGLQKLGEYINQIKSTPQGTNWTPLAAYIDAQMPNSHLADAAKSMAPMSTEQRNQMIFDLQNKLQGGTAALSKGKADALAEQMQMAQQQRRDSEDARYHSLLAQNGANKTNFMGERLATQKDAQAQRAGDLWDKDSMLNTLQARRNQIDIDRHTLETSEIITPQMADELATGLASALNNGKAVGLEQARMQQIRDYQTEAAKLKQYAGKPYNALTDAQRANFEKTFQRIGDAYMLVEDKRRQQLREGREFASNPLATRVMDAKAQPRNSDSNFSSNSSSDAPKEGETKSYNGDTYKVVDGHWVKQ